MGLNSSTHKLVNCTMALEKFNGNWVQESLDGDITKWLQSLGVGLLARQFAYAGSYGKGLNTWRILIHEGTHYTEQTGPNFWIHQKFKIGAEEKTRTSISDAAPL